jgi:hypothetical protein
MAVNWQKEEKIGVVSHDRRTSLHGRAFEKGKGRIRRVNRSKHPSHCFTLCRNLELLCIDSSLNRFIFCPLVPFRSIPPRNRNLFPCQTNTMSPGKNMYHDMNSGYLTRSITMAPSMWLIH